MKYLIIFLFILISCSDINNHNINQYDNIDEILISCEFGVIKSFKNYKSKVIIEEIFDQYSKTKKLLIKRN